MTILQDLNLKTGERARCAAGSPRTAFVMVECILDFSNAPNSSDIVDNHHKYIKVIDQGLYGLITSHLISANWSKVRRYVNHPDFGRGFIVGEKILTEVKLGRMLQVQFSSDVVWVDEDRVSYEN